jgi:flagellin-specific chaperone FliS
MNPAVAYRQPYSPGWTRVDMLLALYDGAIERLELAASSLRSGDRMTAVRLLTRAATIVAELVGGVDPHYVHAQEFLHLYGVVSTGISRVTLADTEGSLSLLRAMRDGLADCRGEASRLEREGVLPPAGTSHITGTTA